MVVYISFLYAFLNRHGVMLQKIIIFNDIPPDPGAEYKNIRLVFIRETNLIPKRIYASTCL
jgi:hypothetical protein